MGKMTMSGARNNCALKGSLLCLNVYVSSAISSCRLGHNSFDQMARDMYACCHAGDSAGLFVTTDEMYQGGNNQFLNAMYNDHNQVVQNYPDAAPTRFFGAPVSSESNYNGWGQGL